MYDNVKSEPTALCNRSSKKFSTSNNNVHGDLWLKSGKEDEILWEKGVLTHRSNTHSALSISNVHDLKQE